MPGVRAQHQEQRSCFSVCLAASKAFGDRFEGLLGICQGILGGFCLSLIIGMQ